MPHRSRLAAPAARPARTRSGKRIETSARPADVAVAPDPTPRPRPRPSPWPVRAARPLGSLKLAVGLLTAFAVVLAVGTVVESWYSSAVAQDLVYGTWWFALLLAALGANIAAAAVKKWPWKRHQTGFLITHLGLLALLAGGVWNCLGGVDADVMAVDSGRHEVAEQFRLPRTIDRAYLRGETEIAVRRVRSSGLKDAERVVPFRPGSLRWEEGRRGGSDPGPLLSALDRLAHPSSKGLASELEGGATLEVVAFYPHARREPFRPVEPGRHGFPALSVRLGSSRFGTLEPQWIWSDPDGPQSRPLSRVGPGLIEWLGPCPPEMREEFRDPPAAGTVGPRGQLVLKHAGRTLRLDVAVSLGRAVDAGDGATVTVARFTPRVGGSEDEAVPVDPAVEFVWEHRGKATTYLATARALDRCGAIEGEDDPASRPAFWYHPPDPRYGEGEALRGVLQFASVGDDGALDYRSFNSHDGGFRFEGAGEVGVGEAHDLWSGMGWTFQVETYLPRAEAGERYIPQDERPGLERAGLVQAVRCRIGRDGDEAVVTLAQGQSKAAEVRVGGETYEVAFRRKEVPLGFELTLLRAEQTVDPGTQQPSSFSSLVQITDREAGLRGEDRMITMNRPLVHGGVRVYQANYGALGRDGSGRLISFSGFVVGRDPGLGLKYAGSTMLALGIACMFFMRAYSFKPRRRVGDAAGRPVEEAAADV